MWYIVRIMWYWGSLNIYLGKQLLYLNNKVWLVDHSCQNIFDNNNNNNNERAQNGKFEQAGQRVKLMSIRMKEYY